MNRVFATRLCFTALIAFVSTPVVGRAQAASLHAPIAFVGVTVVPMDSERLIGDQTVVVTDGRIVAVGPSQSTTIPPSATRIDGRGKFLMPGLSDMHVHFASGLGRDATLDTALLKMYVANGVTTVLCLSGSPALQSLRARVNTGEIFGPTIFSSGPIMNDSTMTAAGAAESVRAQKAAGYDFIKVYNLLPRSAYSSILATAHEVHIPVIGHVVRSMGAEASIRAGQVGVVHAEEFVYTYFNYQNRDTIVPRAGDLDETKLPALAQLLKEYGVTVTPTLETYKTILAEVDNPARVAAWPELRFVPPTLLKMWNPANNTYTQRYKDLRQIGRFRFAYLFQLHMVRAFSQAGVRLVTGTDALVPTIIPGYQLLAEMQNFVEAGLSHYQALVASTRAPAEYLGHADDFGTVAVGKRGDLLLLAANPLVDVRNTSKREGVLLHGRWYTETELKHMMDEAAAAYASQR